MPQQFSAINNAGSHFCVLSSKGSEGHLLYSTDVVHEPSFGVARVGSKKASMITQAAVVRLRDDVSERQKKGRPWLDQ